MEKEIIEKLDNLECRIAKLEDICSKLSPKSSKMQRPTLKEIEGYFQERQNGLDAESFYAFYESCGWKVGNKPMKKWKMAVITWEKRAGVSPLSKDEAKKWWHGGVE